MNEEGERPTDAKIALAINGLSLAQKKYVDAQIAKVKTINAEEIFELGSFKGDIQQGDILVDMPIFGRNEIKSLMSRQKSYNKIKKGPAIVISNTCDIVRDQKRAIRLVYCPILKFDKYKKELSKANENSSVMIGMEKQFKSQVFDRVMSLPPTEKVNYDGMLFLDYILSVDYYHIMPNVRDVSSRWAGSMSLAGWYLLMTKLTSFYYSPTADQIEYRIRDKKV